MSNPPSDDGPGSPSRYETVSYELRDRVAVITLNRPDRMNAFTGVMAMELKSAMSEAANDPVVRSIVLTGAGRAFCSGADMSSLSQGIPLSGDPETMRRLEGTFDSDLGPDFDADVAGADRFGYFLRTKKPVIAALNGATVGLGLVAALYADVRFAANEAFLMTSFGQRGLIAEHGLAWLLSRQTSPAVAMDLLISSRRVSAAEAKALTLVSDVYPQDELLERAVAYAAVIAETMSPRAVAVMKAQVWHANFTTFPQALVTANEETRRALKHGDKDEGIAAFMQKRRPRFADI